jgi:hypothetical protein
VKRTVEHTKALIEESKRRMAKTKEMVELIEQQRKQVQKHLRDVGSIFLK